MDIAESPDLSVVVGAVDDRADVLETLRALRTQDPSARLEIILAANAGHPGCVTAAQVPGVRVIESSTPRLVPELWGLGVNASQAPIVAITMTGCVPEPGWVAGIRRAHRGAAAAIGGAIEQRSPSPIGDWALYFARYAAYGGLTTERVVADVPGDNGSYKRLAIAGELPEIGSRGFWETEINARLRQRGEQMLMTPGIVVLHTHSYGVRAFSRQRWRHGRLHGQRQLAGAGFGVRAARALMAPLAWTAMMMRVTRRALGGRHRAQFAMASPLIGWFYLCWIAGEVTGLLESAE